MTAIVAVEQDGSTWIGGDSFAGNAWSVGKVGVPKVFARGHLVFGYTSTFRFGQLLEHMLPLPEQVVGEAPEHYMVKVANAVRGCLDTHGHLKDGEGGYALCAYKGGMYLLQSDFSCVRVRKAGGAAVGAGQDYALGALAAARKKPPAKRVRLALEAAEELSPLVCGPFVIIRQDADGTATVVA